MKTIVTIHQKHVKIHYQKSNERLRISTGVYIEDNSQFLNGKLKSTFPDYKSQQFKIDKKQQEIEAVITNYYSTHNEYPSTRELRFLVNNQSQPNPTILPPIQSNKNALLPHFKEFVKIKKSDFSIRGKQAKSIKDYENVFQYLNDFELFLGCVIKLGDVTKQWLNEFVKFLETPRKGRRYFSNGNLCGKTIKKRIVLLLSFYKWLDEEDVYPYPKGIRGYSKYVKDSPTVKTTFSLDEVKQIYEFSTPIKQHEFVRDVFVFACYTGFRWSDIISLGKQHLKQIEGVGFVLEKLTVKTNQRVIVPLNHVALTIFEKWDYNFNRYPNATFNKALKLFLHRTQLFEEDTEFIKPTGGYKKVYEITSIHRARDIFVTSLLNKRVPIPEVMKYTGHRSMTTLMGYTDIKKQVKNYTSELLL